MTDVIYPTTGFRYGTVIESYSHTYNLLDTLAHTVDQYRELPFARTVTISLTTDPLAWKAWLAGRFPDGGEDMRRRLEEAESSIRWSLAQADDHHWLVNRPDSIGDTARALITMVKHTQLAAPVPPEAEELLSCAKNLLSYDIEKREHHG